MKGQTLKTRAVGAFVEMKLSFMQDKAVNGSGNQVQTSCGELHAKCYANQCILTFTI